MCDERIDHLPVIRDHARHAIIAIAVQVPQRCDDAPVALQNVLGFGVVRRLGDDVMKVPIEHQQRFEVALFRALLEIVLNGTEPRNLSRKSW